MKELRELENNLKECYGIEVDDSCLRRIVDELRVINKQLEVENIVSEEVVDKFSEVIGDLSILVEDIEIEELKKQ